MSLPPPSRDVSVALVIGQLELGGGAERQVGALAPGLVAEGFRPLVVSLRAGPAHRPTEENYWAGRLRERGVRVHEVHRAGNRDLRRLWPLALLLRRESPAIVHSFMFAANAYARTAALLARRGSLLITSERTGRLQPGIVSGIVDRLLDRRTDGTITNARAIAHLLEERGARAPLWVVPNGIDVPPPAPSARAAARSALGLNDADLVIGTVARMSPEKNYPLFIRLVREAARIVGPVRAIAIGDGPLRADVEAEARREGLHGVLKFAGRREDVAALLPAFDVFVLVSHFEGLSNALLEAQGCGLPCLATDVGGNGEVVLEGRTGFLAPPGRLDLLGEHLVSLLRNAGLRAALGDEARRRVAVEFSMEKMIAATAAVYRWVLHRRFGPDPRGRW